MNIATARAELFLEWNFFQPTWTLIHFVGDYFRFSPWDFFASDRHLWSEKNGSTTTTCWHLSSSLSLSLSLTLTQSLSLLVSYLYTLSTESLTLSFSHIGRYTFLSLSFSLIHLSLYHSLFLSISHYISHSHTYTQSIAAVTHTLSPLHRYRYVAISTPFLHMWPKLYKAYSISLSFTLWFQNLRSFYHLSLSLCQIFLLWLYTNLSLSSLDTNAGKYFISQRLKFGWGLNLASRWDLEINKRKKNVHKRRVKLFLRMEFVTNFFSSSKSKVASFNLQKDKSKFC